MPHASAPEPFHPPAASSRLRYWTLVFGAWTVVSAFSIGQSYAVRYLSGSPLPTLAYAASNLANAWLWALLTPLIFRLSRRFPIVRARWGRDLALHAFFGIVFSASSSLFDYAVGHLLWPRAASQYLPLFFREIFLNVISYGAVVVACHAVDYHRMLSERRLATSLLETQLARAQLAALEMQLRPHFLFNTLHSIAGLIRTGQQQAAIRMLTGLGDLLRAVLRREGGQEVTLRQELALVEHYLGIERIRFADRLRTTVEAPPELLDAMVPGLVLQPLVENAIRHGIEVKEGDGSVAIRAARDGDQLVLEVRDSGAGLSPDSANGGARGGIGLQNTQARLRHLYGERQHFELTGTPEGGALARVSLPFHVAPEAEAGR